MCGSLYWSTSNFYIIRWQSLSYAVPWRSTYSYLPSAIFVIFFWQSYRALRQPITSVKFNFLRGKFRAVSVVIRAAKLKCVAESRTRIYLEQNAASTCDTILLRNNLVTKLGIRTTVQFVSTSMMQVLKLEFEVKNW